MTSQDSLSVLFDGHRSHLGSQVESEERIASVATWWDAPYFADVDRATLTLIQAIFQPNALGEERVPDDLYAEASSTTTKWLGAL